MYHPDSVYLYNREAAAVAAQRAALERAGHLGSLPPGHRDAPQSISGSHQATIASRMQGFHPSDIHLSYPYPPGSDYAQWASHAAYYPSAPPSYYYPGYEQHPAERLGLERGGEYGAEGKPGVATEGTRDERASLSKARLQGREDAPDDVPHPVPGDKSSPLPPASAKAAAAAAQLKARRDRDTSKAKQELPVVSPYQRNAVFGKNGSLVTGRSKKDKHSEKHPSAKTGSGESGKSSLTTDAVEQGAQKNKKIPLRVLPKIRPSLTKSVLGVSNFSQVRSILLQQQDSYVQQVADFQRIIARQHFASSRRPKPRAEECPEVEDRPAEPLRGKRSGKTSAFREMGKKSSVEKTVHPVHPKKSLSARASREQKAEHAAPSKDAVKSTNEGDNKRSADKRKRPYPAEPGSPCEDSEAKRRPEGYDADLPASAAAASYDAAMAAYSYHQHMMHQMAAAGMPPPGMPSPASYPPSMDPYAMQYMAAMQNPNWYFGYGAPSSSSRGYSKY